MRLLPLLTLLLLSVIVTYPKHAGADPTDACPSATWRTACGRFSSLRTSALADQTVRAARLGEGPWEVHVGWLYREVPNSGERTCIVVKAHDRLSSDPQSGPAHGRTHEYLQLVGACK